MEHWKLDLWSHKRFISLDVQLILRTPGWWVKKWAPPNGGEKTSYRFPNFGDLRYRFPNWTLRKEKWLWIGKYYFFKEWCDFSPRGTLVAVKHTTLTQTTEGCKGPRPDFSFQIIITQIKIFLMEEFVDSIAICIEWHHFHVKHMRSLWQRQIAKVSWCKFPLQFINCLVIWLPPPADPQT